MASQRKENPPKTSIQTKNISRHQRPLKMLAKGFPLIDLLLWASPSIMDSSTGINFRRQMRTRQRQAKRPPEGHIASQWRAMTTHNAIQSNPLFHRGVTFHQKEGVTGSGWFSRVVTKPGVSEPLERRGSHLARIKQEVRTTFFSSSMSPKLGCPKKSSAATRG